MGTGALSPAKAQSKETEATSAEQRLLGSADDDARVQELLPFTRTYGASGVVTGSLADSGARAGVPRAALVAALRAWDAAVDVPKPQDGDRFYVSWQHTFTVEGQPIGIGRVQWMEVRSASGNTAAIHRFRPSEGGEQFFLTSGQAAKPPTLALPVEQVMVSSPFGLRGDPFAGGEAVGPVPGALPLPHYTAGRYHSARAAQIAAMVAMHQAHRQFAGYGPRLLAPRAFMHEGVDLAVPIGTPVYAASDGVIEKVGPYAGYGNYVRIEHGDGLATAYGHLSRFAPGIKPGVHVSRGELVAFSGSTGRSTGPHLHFEVLTDGRPVDPLTRAKIGQLAGVDLTRFDRLVAEREHERDRDREQSDR
ncbi:MAG: M23 family metallopeptidase [Proteobacteria bacterium]|nr:M23 family metallopeptidase [Pseudomonadota bacterium]